MKTMSPERKALRDKAWKMFEQDVSITKVAEALEVPFSTAAAWRSLWKGKDYPTTHLTQADYDAQHGKAPAAQDVVQEAVEIVASSATAEDKSKELLRLAAEDAQRNYEEQLNRNTDLLKQLEEAKAEITRLQTALAEQEKKSVPVQGQPNWPVLKAEVRQFLRNAIISAQDAAPCDFSSTVMSGVHFLAGYLISETDQDADDIVDTWRLKHDKH